MPLRAEQQEIANYAGGRLAVSAVPGSGKTYTLAALAARMLAQAGERSNVFDERELLVVTFTTSAVDNIRNRIRRQLSDLGLTDGGYRVLTLHGLAHLIVRTRPDLAGTGSDFSIDDEVSGGQALTDAVRWFTDFAYSDTWQSFLPQDSNAQTQTRTREAWRSATYRLASEVTRLSKNLRLGASELRSWLDGTAPGPQMAGRILSPYLDIGARIYERYEKLLAQSGRLDFDDLIGRAIGALESNEEFRASLNSRWYAILEDEAQDSTPLQEQILGLLSRDHNNWVRVGDPNQAIMTTFTASDVRFFREFCVVNHTLPLTRSGRSTPQIIELANWLTRWSTHNHPVQEVRRVALSEAVQIVPLEAGETPGNPTTGRVHFEAYANDETEYQRVAKSAAGFVLKNEEKTCAILTLTNQAGDEIVKELEAEKARLPLAQRELPLFADQLKNPKPVRDVADALALAVRFCSNPLQAGVLDKLRVALLALNVGSKLPVVADEKQLLAVLASKLNIEQLLYPWAGGDPALPKKVVLSEDALQQLTKLTTLVARWVRASLLPVDQLMLTIAQDVLTRDNELAIAHSLALSMRRYAALNPSAQLGDLADKLKDIANNRQSFLSRSLLEAGFEPQPGVITVTTLHKAKGLEWDRVYMVCVDTLDFPHDPEATNWRGEQWYLGGRDPATEARKSLEHEFAARRPTQSPRETIEPDRDLLGDQMLIREARIEAIAERLRLLYVGVTRAKSELQISFSRTRGRSTQNRLALAMEMWKRTQTPVD